MATETRSSPLADAADPAVAVAASETEVGSVSAVSTIMRPVLSGPRRDGPRSQPLDALITELDARLDGIAAAHPGHRVKLASSLAAEDMVLTHAILSRRVDIGIFTLQTGRLHAETVGMLDTVANRYGYRIETFEPQPDAVARYVDAHGLNAFYESVALRKACCDMRKVEPLNRALAGVDAWVTGQRREQSVTRTELPHREHDGARDISKYNPLADWTEADVWAYLDQLDVPVNPLHARGYPSIGCEPCTRAVRVGEDSRAGRWWWESRDTKECGLHQNAVTSDSKQ
ncbi:phosphoadenylyl-sulfate reductase [Robbsia sp. KACC 23696]|uniref:phosphoadenylyl-sulfate reductase n=1 Tax=Robbsia sp. KACC 23696 TaxID=3149231 RepID=UPI00325C042B